MSCVRLIIILVFIGCASPGAMQPGPPSLEEVRGERATAAPARDAAVSDARPEISARHVLIRVGEFPNGKSHTLAEAHAIIDDLRARVRAGADFAAIAKQWSEDTANARRGGDLGSFSRGGMVQSFEDVAFSLSVGQLGVAETVFGVHLIQRTR